MALQNTSRMTEERNLRRTSKHFVKQVKLEQFVADHTTLNFKAR